MRLAVLLLVVFAAHAEDDRPERPVAPALQARINLAIGNGCAHLRRVQQKDGSWAHREPHAQGGLTALAIYALAASRTRGNDDAIRKALRWLQRNPASFAADASYATYCNALYLLALTRVDAKRHRTGIRALAKRLAAGQLANGAWTYTLAGKRSKVGDNSNSQFAILALWSAHALAGVPVPRGFWHRIRKLYRHTELKRGGWGYKPRRIAEKTKRPAMTAAALVALTVAEATFLEPDGLAKARTLPPVARGRAALRTRPRGIFDPYFSYSVERAATVLDLPLDTWYVPGAKAFCAQQEKDGRWKGAAHDDQASVYGTSLVLLFLSRATIKIVTPHDDGRAPPTGPVTKREEFADPKSDLARAFDQYVVFKADARARVRPRFARAGRAAVRHFIKRLRDDDEAVRAAAFELIDTLVAKKFFFDPAWPADERAAMADEIARFWRVHGEDFRWDAARGRWVP